MKKFIVLIALVAFLGVMAAPLTAAPAAVAIEEVKDKKDDKKDDKKSDKACNEKKSDCCKSKPCDDKKEKKDPKNK